MLFFAFFSSIYTFYINKKWYFRNLLSKIPFCQQSVIYYNIFISLSNNALLLSEIIEVVTLTSTFILNNFEK